MAGECYQNTPQGNNNPQSYLRHHPSPPRVSSSTSSAAAAARKPRPSRSRGLRASTGCVTCRARRIKCDEGRPRCGRCIKAEKPCSYAKPERPKRRGPRTESRTEEDYRTHDDYQKEDNGDRGQRVSPGSPEEAGNNTGREEVVGRPQGLIHGPSPGQGPGGSVSTVSSHTQAQHSQRCQDMQTTLSGDPMHMDHELGFSPLGQTPSPHFNGSALDWYDLLAQDAISDLQKGSHVLNGSQWTFDETTLSRRQSPAPDDSIHGGPLGTEGDEPGSDRPYLEQHVEAARLRSGETARRLGTTTPWNTDVRIALHGEELEYLQYYVSTVGPILDLMDPDRHFSIAVPHLAMHNVGLLKAILAIAARHMALQGDELDPDARRNVCRDDDQRHRQTRRHMATQFYYETLHYLSQNLLYPSYTNSPEIISTAILIGVYEMFEVGQQSSSGNWERHLRGSFWIQRTQDNNAESNDSLRRATWWVWIRQDIWAAFREGRRTFTIFRARRGLETLSPDELATRIFWITARCVDFAADAKTLDVGRCIQQGDRLLHELNRWYSLVPPSFYPMFNGARSSMGDPQRRTIGRDNSAPDNTAMTGATSVPSIAAGQTITTESEALEAEEALFPAIWIHPPAYAAAVQMFHFARILVLLNQPSTGGRNIYLKRLKLLDESVDTICGIARAEQASQLPSAFVSAQALYVAGLCVQTPDRKAALLSILKRTLNISKVPHISLVDELAALWADDA